MDIYLAPMEGITTYVFRNAFAKYYGGVDKYFTPFLTASHLKGREERDVRPENNQGINLVPQILANDADSFITIARQLVDRGYSEINLNLGCPSGTVVSKKRGAGVLGDPKLLDELLYGIFEKAENLKISVKTRIGMEFLSEWDDILEVYKKYPIYELIIHPRLRNEFYSGEVHVDEFMKAANVLCINEEKHPKDVDDKTPALNIGTNRRTTSICYNGDIIDLESFDRINGLINKNHFSDEEEYIPIMIGRGILINPSLPKIIKNATNDSLGTFESDHNRLVNSDKNTLRAFLDEIAENYIDEMSHEKQVVMKMKELWTYLAKGLELDKKTLRELLKVNKLSEYKNVLQMIFSQI